MKKKTRKNTCFIFFPQENNKAVHFYVSQILFSGNAWRLCGSLILTHLEKGTCWSPILILQSNRGEVFSESKSLNRLNGNHTEVSLVNNFLYNFTKTVIPPDSRKTEETAPIVLLQ